MPIRKDRLFSFCHYAQWPAKRAQTFLVFILSDLRVEFTERGTRRSGFPRLGAESVEQDPVGGFEQRSGFG